MKENENKVTYESLEDIMDVPEDYYIISEPKLKIVKAISEKTKQDGLSIRGLAKKIGMHHPQVIKVTSAGNYTIDTLLKVLHGAGLELIVQPKKEN